MISFRSKEDFSRVTRYLERVKEAVKLGLLDKYGRAGVDALQEATPKASGETANSWYYKIEHRSGSATIGFYNSHINKGVPIAIILQYGHGTGTGGYVEGVDYINPALKPVFEKLAAEAWKEVTRV